MDTRTQRYLEKVYDAEFAIRMYGLYDASYAQSSVQRPHLWSVTHDNEWIEGPDLEDDWVEEAEAEPGSQ